MPDRKTLAAEAARLRERLAESSRQNELLTRTVEALGERSVSPDLLHAMQAALDLLPKCRGACDDVTLSETSDTLAAAIKRATA